MNTGTNRILRGNIAPPCYNHNIKDLEDYLFLLQTWDYQDSMDSAPAALYATFQKNFLIYTIECDLPVDMQSEGSTR